MGTLVSASDAACGQHRGHTELIGNVRIRVATMRAPISITDAVAARRLPLFGTMAWGTAVAALVVGLLAALSGAVAFAQDDPPPTFASAVIAPSGDKLELTFSESIGPPELLRTVAGLVKLDLDYFYGAVMDVEVNGERTYVKSAEISVSEMEIPLDATVGSGAVVRVAYDNIFARDAVGLFVDGGGNALQTFSWQSVTNGSTASAESVGAQEPRLVISTVGLTVTEGGDAATYTVKLSAAPSGDETVYIEAENDPYGKLTLSPETLTFTTENWNSPQTVSVSGSRDDDEINYWVVLQHDSDLTTSATGFTHVRVLMVEGQEESVEVESTGGS